jgi:hypothetical protein
MLKRYCQVVTETETQIALTPIGAARDILAPPAWISTPRSRSDHAHQSPTPPGAGWQPHRAPPRPEPSRCCVPGRSAP